MMYSIHVIAEDTDSEALLQCEHSSAPCHITYKEISMLTISRTVHSDRYLQRRWYLLSCNITNKEVLMSTIILRTIHSVRYLQRRYAFSICTCTTLSYYEQERYSVVFDIYCFATNILFWSLLMNMQFHVLKWRVVVHCTHLPTYIPPTQYTYFGVLYAYARRHKFCWAGGAFL